jgi:hypothetical protein
MIQFDDTLQVATTSSYGGEKEHLRIRKHRKKKGYG